MERYVIECRDPAGNLDFTGPQPESVFGLAAIQGISEAQMAEVVYSRLPDWVVLRGEHVAKWPSLVDSRWIARRKYW